MDKKEIHKITKRQMERFNKLKERDAKVVVSPECRREELLARKAKVKQLDDVINIIS